MTEEQLLPVNLCRRGGGGGGGGGVSPALIRDWTGGGGGEAQAGLADVAS